MRHRERAPPTATHGRTLANHAHTPQPRHNSAARCDTSLIRPQEPPGHLNHTPARPARPHARKAPGSPGFTASTDADLRHRRVSAGVGAAPTPWGGRLEAGGHAGSTDIPVAGERTGAGRRPGGAGEPERSSAEPSAAPLPNALWREGEIRAGGSDGDGYGRR